MHPLDGVGYLAGWLTQLRTGHDEPNLPNFFSHMDREHTPINLSGGHHNFPCQDDATVISTTEDPQGLPRSGASSSSNQTAAGRLPSMFGPSSLWQQMAGHVCVVQASRKLGRFWTENLLQQRFLFTVEREERSRYKRCAFVERQRKSPKQSLKGLLTRPSEER